MKNFSWLVLAGALVAAPAAAQDKGLYAGGSVGQAEYADTCDDFAGVSSCKDHDTGWRAFAGYSYNRNFALELGYADLGEVTVASPGLAFVAKATGFDLSALFSFGIADRLSLFGRVGGYRMRTQADFSVGGLPGNSGESNTGFTYGAGLEYQLAKLGLRAEWQRWDNAGGGTTGEDTIDLYSLGLLLRF